jgi:hypothetical protein
VSITKKPVKIRKSSKRVHFQAKLKGHLVEALNKKARELRYASGAQVLEQILEEIFGEKES